MKRIASKTVTDTLALAMEGADQMKNVVVLYETIEAEDKEKPAFGMYVNEDVTLETFNYMLDNAKHWIFG
jgi:hypothetical protein